MVLIGHIPATIWSVGVGGHSIRLRVDQALIAGHVNPLDKDFIMRKFVLAAAIATSALGLAACSETAEQAGETVDAMAADTEANAEAAGEMADEMADDAAESVDGVADEAGEAADDAEGAVEEATADAEAMMDGE